MAAPPLRARFGARPGATTGRKAASRWAASGIWAGLAAGVWFAPGVSWAQTITLTVSEINESTEARKGNRRRSGRRPNWISYQDCLDDRQFSFPIGLTQTGFPIEVWAGTDNCAERRGQQDNGQCWMVYRATSSANTAVLEFPVRNVVARRLNESAPPAGLTDEVCEGDAAAALGEQLTFYILQERGGQAIAQTSWDGGQDGTGYDLVGPSPPSGVAVGLGENQLSVELNGVDEDVDRLRFRAFCVPATTAEAGSNAPEPARPTPADASDVGDAMDAGSVEASSGTSDEALSPPADCVQSVLVENQRAPVDDSFACGEASEFSTRLRTDSNLVNGQLYAVAVAGEDVVGNRGAISQVQCATPRELTDFFELYTEAGGPGGGGFCAFRRATSSRGGAAGAAWLTLAGLALLGRRGAGRTRLRRRCAQSPKELS